MTIIFIILITLASVILGFIVLVQNPKGGGLAGNVAGLSNQFMGVKQTTDVLEKGTWIFGGIVALLCLFSTFFIPAAGSGDGTTPTKEVIVPQTQQPTNNQAPLGPPPAKPAQ